MSSIVDPPVQAAKPPCAAPTPGLQVYYDGACPVCSREIAVYQNSPGGETIHWVDASSCPINQLQGASADLSRESALARMHVRRPDGELVSGAAAFVAMWEHLPRFAWLARVAKLPGVRGGLELAYRVFLRLRPLWRKPASNEANSRVSDRANYEAEFPAELRRELRTDHAGEAGAVMIYKGVLAVSKDAGVRRFAQHHLATEQEHLRLIEEIVPATNRSILIPLWRLSGWLTGALPALFGARAVFATIAAVETFVDQHYAEQLTMIDRINQAQNTSLIHLRALLARCQSDEVAHRDDAASRLGSPARGLLRTWTTLVGVGSKQAVRVCRII